MQLRWVCGSARQSGSWEVEALSRRFYGVAKKPASPGFKCSRSSGAESPGTPATNGGGITVEQELEDTSRRWVDYAKFERIVRRNMLSVGEIKAGVGRIRFDPNNECEFVIPPSATTEGSRYVLCAVGLRRDDLSTLRLQTGKVVNVGEPFRFVVPLDLDLGDTILRSYTTDPGCLLGTRNWLLDRNVIVVRNMEPKPIRRSVWDRPDLSYNVLGVVGGDLFGFFIVPGAPPGSPIAGYSAGCVRTMSTYTSLGPVLDISVLGVSCQDRLLPAVLPGYFPDPTILRIR